MLMKLFIKSYLLTFFLVFFGFMAIVYFMMGSVGFRLFFSENKLYTLLMINLPALFSSFLVVLINFRKKKP